MKTILALAFVLVAGLASATELKVPKGKTAMAKTPPPVVQPLPQIPGETCMERVKRACTITHRTRLFTAACVRRNAYRCR
jgi:hypothetical protein